MLMPKIALFIDGTKSLVMELMSSGEKALMTPDRPGIEPESSNLHFPVTRSKSNDEASVDSISGFSPGFSSEPSSVKSMRAFGPVCEPLHEPLPFQIVVLCFFAPPVLALKLEVRPLELNI